MTTPDGGQVQRRRIRVALVDDYEVVLEGLSSMLRSYADDFEAAGAAGHGPIARGSAVEQRGRLRQAGGASTHGRRDRRVPGRMEPLPETSTAARLLRFRTHHDMLPELRLKAARVGALVPDCLAVSLSLLDHNVTLTLVASGTDFVLLDALQFMARSSACPDDQAVDAGEGATRDILDEHAWQRAASEASAVGVASSLTMPIFDYDRLVGAVSFHGGSANAFGGHRQELADIFGARSDAAVTNADLSFAARLSAGDAPRRVAGDIVVDQASHTLGRELGIEPATARQHLQATAADAGIGVVELAIWVIQDES